MHALPLVTISLPLFPELFQSLDTASNPLREPTLLFLLVPLWYCVEGRDGSRWDEFLGRSAGGKSGWVGWKEFYLIIYRASEGMGRFFFRGLGVLDFLFPKLQSCSSLPLSLSLPHTPAVGSIFISKGPPVRWRNWEAAARSKARSLLGHSTESFERVRKSDFRFTCFARSRRPAFSSTRERVSSPARPFLPRFLFVLLLLLLLLQQPEEDYGNMALGEGRIQMRSGREGGREGFYYNSTCSGKGIESKWDEVGRE